VGEIRNVRAGDERGLAEVCVRTADAGGDATGLIDDRIWAEVFVLPYAMRHPEFAFVVADGDRLLGYVVGAPDTAAFEAWFRDEWWPERGAAWPRPQTRNTRQDKVLDYAYGRAPGAEPFEEAYPAHLHIDLLPETQGQGWGRRLIEALLDALRAAGIPGVHLVADARNTGALAFYDRLGFARLPSPQGVQAFGLSLDS
jgi:ribosomal protein S18 acetylase RimI-like enzyme